MIWILVVGGVFLLASAFLLVLLAAVGIAAWRGRIRRPSHDHHCTLPPFHTGRCECACGARTRGNGRGWGD